VSASDFLTPDVVLTHLLVVSDIDRSKGFYQDVLGATVYREYGGTSCVLSFQGSWLLLVTSGGPTRDKPDVSFAPPSSFDLVSHEMTYEGT
jgi:catechol 2,3-dioxygenase-like lactoylglutathione lyase family enzyme